MFVSKTNQIYQWIDFSSTNILNNIDILSNYSLKEIDNIYKTNRLGDVEFIYKDILLVQISLYDKSNNVNSFIVNGIDFWLDKNTRVGLAHLANCTEGVMQLVLGDTVLEIESSVMKEMLVQLERYAAQCYLQTQKHLIAIKELKTVEDIINYDYTKGYPEKLTFTV